MQDILVEGVRSDILKVSAKKTLVLCLWKWFVCVLFEAVFDKR